jgi:Uma2 family endonuclease
MSDPAHQTSLTETQYLALEHDSKCRHEYIGGQVYAMSGAGKNHRMITMSLSSAIYQHLVDSPCNVNALDARVKVASNYFYPDIVVDCDESSDGNSLYAEQPTLIVEVLSNSTRHIDKGPKLLNYINITSVEEYVMIEQDLVSIDILRREDNWLLRHYGPGDTVEFKSIDLHMPIEQLYARVDNEDITAYLASKKPV